MTRSQKRKLLDERRADRKENTSKRRAAKHEASLQEAERVMTDALEILELMDPSDSQIPFPIHATHDCVTCGGFVGCTRCAATASTMMKGSKLAEACPGNGKKGTGSANRVARLLRGQIPRSEIEEWPDGSSDPKPKRLRLK